MSDLERVRFDLVLAEAGLDDFTRCDGNPCSFKADWATICPKCKLTVMFCTNHRDKALYQIRHGGIMICGECSYAHFTQHDWRRL